MDVFFRVTGYPVLTELQLKYSIVFLLFINQNMKKRVVLVGVAIIFSILSFQDLSAQCSICTKTAQQLGKKPAEGLNAGIIYLASAPFLIAGYVYYRWKKSGHSD